MKIETFKRFEHLEEHAVPVLLETADSAKILQTEAAHENMYKQGENGQSRSYI